MSLPFLPFKTSSPIFLHDSKNVRPNLFTISSFDLLTVEKFILIENGYNGQASH